MIRRESCYCCCWWWSIIVLVFLFWSDWSACGEWENMLSHKELTHSCDECVFLIVLSLWQSNQKVFFECSLPIRLISSFLPVYFCECIDITLTPDMSFYCLIVFCVIVYVRCRSFCHRWISSLSISFIILSTIFMVTWKPVPSLCLLMTLSENNLLEAMDVITINSCFIYLIIVRIYQSFI